jgi:hypothetical protein
MLNDKGRSFCLRFNLENLKNGPNLFLIAHNLIMQNEKRMVIS